VPSRIRASSCRFSSYRDRNWGYLTRSAIGAFEIFISSRSGWWQAVGSSFMAKDLIKGSFYFTGFGAGNFHLPSRISLRG